ncbi:MAG TPA: beta-N-acetylhexosaminidase [Gemmatimonadaceae bacterium]|nr:beta-N-acetylhexosaminidase [Gemmatimonadaceae bacterium]
MRRGTAPRIAGLAALLVVPFVPVAAQHSTDAIRVVPYPEHVEARRGAFTLRDPVRIVADTANVRLGEIAEFLARVIGEQTGFAVTVEALRGTDPAIVLTARGAAHEAEDYELTVSPAEIRIDGTSPRGVLWGVQTLRQLLPPAFEDPTVRQAAWIIPAVSIRDRPKFRWRGSLFDVSRHFFPVEFVERYIDLLSRYKMNVLHWHLTDDQGWRIEIAKYPRLTEVGAWRLEPDGSRYGGFYTRDEIRRVVEYARLRNVTVVPEIEMPGHAQAAIAAYPELGCTGDSVPVATSWGVMREIYCAGNERTFEFLEGVLDEVLALFPSEYIHIGGDEVPKDRWRACDSCQALMRREGLADEAALQSWFVRRIERYLSARGRRLIGWDEILEGGIDTTATVQVWRNMAHAASAVRLGNDVIASPTSHAYFDGSPRSLPLGRVYEFDPVPPGVDDAEASRILGGEANIWTEYITTANFDPMVFPRLLAMAEALWTRGAHDSTAFLRRVRDDQVPRLRAMDVTVGPEDRDVVRLTTHVDSVSLAAYVRVERGVEGLVVRFTEDGTVPTQDSEVYDPSIRFERPGMYTVRPFLNGEGLPVSRTVEVDHHAARGKPVRLTNEPSRQYPGTGAFTLTDGLLASLDHHDGLWQGFLGRDLEATIDLGAGRPADSIRVTFLQATPSWILLPRSVAVSLSLDETEWTPAGEVSHEIPATREERLRHAFELVLPSGSRARYIKVVARNPGPLPPWHAGAGRPSWIFADEIVVR